MRDGAVVYNVESIQPKVCVLYHEDINDMI